MKISTKLFIPLLCILFIQCSTKTYNEQKILGSWFSTEWLSDGQNTHRRAWFEFNEDKSYRAVLQDNQEEGKWWIDGYKLFTQADGGDKIMVKISALDAHNLELTMNRGGSKEILKLNRGH